MGRRWAALPSPDSRSAGLFGSGGVADGLGDGLTDGLSEAELCEREKIT
jgi:hypothetical protein